MAGLHIATRTLLRRGRVLSSTIAECGIIFRDETIVSRNVYRIQRVNWRHGKANYSTGTSDAARELASKTAKEAASKVARETATATASAGAKAVEPKQSKFRQYAEQFKNKPASHLISFGILHEITAVVPLPIVYFGLVETGIKIPFPEQAMEEGNRFVSRVAKYYGWNLEGAEGARVMLNMATSYAVVKALLPVRLALCVWMTPWTATRVVSPIMNFWRRFKK